MIFLGNKQDLDSLQQRVVLKEDVAEWVFCELPKLRTKVSDTLFLLLVIIFGKKALGVGFKSCYNDFLLHC